MRVRSATARAVAWTLVACAGVAGIAGPRLTTCARSYLGTWALPEFVRCLPRDCAALARSAEAVGDAGKVREAIAELDRADAACDFLGDAEGDEPSGRGSGVVILGGEHNSGAIGFPPVLAQALESRIGGGPPRSPPEGERGGSR